MKISFVACVFIIVSAPLLIISSLPIQNIVPPSAGRNLDQTNEHHVNATGGSVIHSNQDDNDAITEYTVLKYEIASSKRSQGTKGAGGGSNVVREPKPGKSNAVPLQEQFIKPVYVSVCMCLSLFVVFLSS